MATKPVSNMDKDDVMVCCTCGKPVVWHNLRFSCPKCGIVHFAESRSFYRLGVLLKRHESIILRRLKAVCK